MNAENNRVPFDLPEAESEPVAGFHTEYSGMKFAFFMLGEYSMMLVNSSLIVTLYFGGWTLGGVVNGHSIGLTTEVMRGWGFMGGVLGTLIFSTKVMTFMLVYIWFRATFPRFRFDQLMDLGWKWMIPLALANIAVTAIFVLIGAEWLLSVFGAVVLIATIALVIRGPRPAPRQVIHSSPVSET